jgi:hypothetical protein
MTLVCNCTWSMLSPPLGRVKSSNGCGDDVGCLLDNVGESEIKVWRGPTPRMLKQMSIKERCRVDVFAISDMEKVNVVNPEFVLIPIKGGGTNLPVDSEELIYMFPCL